VPDPHRLGGRPGLRIARRSSGVDAEVGERRDEVADRVGELESAFLVEHHGRDRGDRLGHRVDAEERVRLNRFAAFDVPHSVRGQVRDLAPARDERQPAGQLARRDVVLEVLIDPLQPGRVEADLAGIHLDFQSHQGLLPRCST
jgi:hypothetical protein